MSKATCSTRTRTEEEDADEREADSAKDKADEVRSAKWLSKACKFDSTKKGASSKKKAESSRAEEERAGCSSSTHTR